MMQEQTKCTVYRCTGPSLVRWKVVTIIGAVVVGGWGGCTGHLNRLPETSLKDVQESWWATAVRRHESLSFARVLNLANFNIEVI